MRDITDLNAWADGIITPISEGILSGSDPAPIASYRITFEYVSTPNTAMLEKKEFFSNILINMYFLHSLFFLEATTNYLYRNSWFNTRLNSRTINSLQSRRCCFILFSSSRLSESVSPSSFQKYYCKSLYLHILVAKHNSF